MYIMVRLFCFFFFCCWPLVLLSFLSILILIGLYKYSPFYFFNTVTKTCILFIIKYISNNFTIEYIWYVQELDWPFCLGVLKHRAPLAKGYPYSCLFFCDGFLPMCRNSKILTIPKLPELICLTACVGLPVLDQHALIDVALLIQIILIPSQTVFALSP